MESAIFSPCGKYRYVLNREFGIFGPGTLLIVMLNPSTADEVHDDPTIRRCIGFALDAGYRSLSIANLYAYRSTDPRGLNAVPDPIGPDNDAWLRRLAKHATGIWVAWGANAPADRATQVSKLLAWESGQNLFCLGTTKSGAPRHPLYLPRASQPRPWQ